MKSELDDDDLSFIEEFLADSISDDYEPEKQKENQFQNDSFHHISLVPSPRLPIKQGAKAQHCVCVFLGGTDLLPGFTRSIIEPHFCNNLHCISCDHIVLRFPKSRWKEDVDYMFLRNNYPNKVDKKIVRKAGWCAFCCQCTKKETNKTITLGRFDSNWVCRGHY